MQVSNVGETLAEAVHFLAGGAGEGVAEGVFLVGKGVDEDAGHEVLALLAEFDGAGHVIGLHALQHLVHQLRVPAAVLPDDEENAFDGDGDEQERHEQDRPHDGSTVLEQFHRGHRAAVGIGQEDGERHLCRDHNAGVYILGMDDFSLGKSRGVGRAVAGLTPRYKKILQLQKTWETKCCWDWRETVNALSFARRKNLARNAVQKNLRIKAERKKLAARLGVEPRQNESESFVLPLHHRAVKKLIGLIGFGLLHSRFGGERKA